MNPFTGTLTRIGFLVWSIVFYALLLLVVVARVRHWIDIGAGTDTTGMVAAYFIIAAFIALGLFVVIRRLQNAGLSSWLSLIALVPIAGYILWLALLFIPPKRSA